MKISLEGKAKIIHCETCMCIYWTADKCMLDEIIIGDCGMCRSCIYSPDIIAKVEEFHPEE